MMQIIFLMTKFPNKIHVSKFTRRRRQRKKTVVLAALLDPEIGSIILFITIHLNSESLPKSQVLKMTCIIYVDEAWKRRDFIVMLFSYSWTSTDDNLSVNRGMCRL